MPTDSIILDGSASNDPDGPINKWLWTKISGPASFNIVNISTAKTAVTNLVVGIYLFELKITDDKGLSANDTMRVTVDAVPTTNHPPVANAGPDQSIILPTNTVDLNGSASTDPDNNIISYLWTKISGPPSLNIINNSAIQTQVTSLGEGVYHFELKVTDLGGLISKDTIAITVQTQQTFCGDGNRPIVNATQILVGTLSKDRWGMSVAAVGNKILFAGGWDLSGLASARVDIYDLTTGTWSIAELSTARGNMATVTAANKIFFGGGDSGIRLDSRYPQDIVDIYDGTTGTWTTSHLSIAGIDIGAATVGNKVLFAGGCCGSGRSTRVDVYNLTTATWSIGQLSEPKVGLSAAALNSRIYFAGGYDGTSSLLASKKIDIYDNATNSWSIDSMYEGKAYFAGCSLADKIYWAGGWGSSGNVASCVVEVKDLNGGSNSIEYLFNPADWNINMGQNAVIKDNKILFFRFSGFTSESNKFDIYDVTTHSWSIGILNEPIPTGASIISVNNTIYITYVSTTLSHVWKLEF